MKYDDIKNKLHNHEKYILTLDKPLISAVMIPLVEIDDKLHILLETRSAKLKTQPLDVSFPGGKIDKSDKDAKSASVREACEELGLNESDIEIITELDTLVAPYGVIIHNFVGKINDISKISINRDEVDHIFYVPISFFMENPPIVYNNKLTYSRDDNFPFHLIPFGENYPFKVGSPDTLFWRYEDKTIWGMTATMINRFIELLK